MKYNSIYDVFLDKNNITYQTFDNSFIGTIDEIFLELDTIVSKRKHDDSELQKLILHPARIIRAIINYNIFTNKKYIEVLSKSTALASEIYNYKNYDNKKILIKLNDLKKELQIISKLPLHQEKDEGTWKASHPNYSRESSKIIHELFQDEPILFIPLAHGGISAGIDVIMKYIAASQSELNNTIIHPIRYSTYKAHDEKPLISNMEKNYLIAASKNHHTILFDEDSSIDAYTMYSAQRYFIDVLEIPTYAIINKPSDSAHRLIEPTKSPHF